MSRTKFVILVVVGVAGVCVAVVWMQGGAPRFHAVEMEVHATPDHVFPYLVEPEKQASWISGLVETHPNQNGPGGAAWAPEIGARWIGVVEKEGNRVEFQAEITRIEKNQLVQLRMHAPFFDAVNHFDLSPSGEGTRVIQNFTVAYTGLVRFLVPFTTDKTRQELEVNLRHLKEAVEQAAPPPASPNGGKYPEPDPPR